MALEGDYGDGGRDDLSPASLGESTQGWPSLFRSTNKATPNLAEMRSSLVRALSDVQRETHRFVDSLPADAKGMVSTLPMAEVRSWEEAENDNLQDAAASIRGGDKRLCWTSEEVETMRGMLCGLLVQTASSLADLQRLRVSGSHWPSADQFGACLGCS
ncbi:unnamed protein product [Symbiodinium natans]|uniref:Uncharacterized protein n=1 Tax=Symbiodinium natans TaxID=878477 RepID=A0A812L2M3_9DINO|nr:unnamed protein product [Symbiodinium natans]